MVEVKVPSVGESISEVQIGRWLKAEGEWIAADQDLLELETEKASVQVPAPESGIVRNIRKQVEEFAMVDDVLCEIEPAPEPAGGGNDDSNNSPATTAADSDSAGDEIIMPAAQRLMEENGLSANDVAATGPGGRILKEDVLQAIEKKKAKPAPQKPKAAPVLESDNALTAPAQPGSRREEVKPLSMIRRTIATRLVEAQQTAALLTTFNEVNMAPIMELRKKYRDAFLERHGVKLGFMSFFAKASVEALRRFPSVNAQIRGNNIVYRHYNDIGIAIGGGKGLVVPVLRNVEDMSFATIEKTIGDFARKAMENRLVPEDLEGGTFTISNGGVYGSMLSTPIVNAPQSAILGLHAIQDRPMAVNGEVVIQPIMYLALTYDHRIIDGREAVSFLKTVKEVCEDPSRLFLEV